MSKSIKIVAFLGLAAFVTACGNGREEEIVFVEPEVVVAEPVSTKF
jgi:hypothetical protein